MLNLASYTNKHLGVAAVVSQLLLVSLISGCGNQVDNADILFERGNLALASGEMEAAVRHFSAALEKSPNRSDIAYERGRAYEALGFLDKAISDYQTCIQQEPDFEGAINNTGVCFAKMQKHDDAIEQFSKLIEMSADNVLALRNRGLCYHDTQQYEAALADYDAALKVDPTDPETWFQRGNVYLENDDQQKAFEDYSEAVRLDPDFSKAWMNRGVALFGLERQTEGMEDLVKASELDENIIIPDLDWVKVSKTSEIKLQPQSQSPQSSSATVTSKAVFDAAKTAGWNQVRSDSAKLLTDKQFSQPTVHAAVPNQLCGILKTERAGQKFSFYVGVIKDSATTIQIPAAPTAAGTKRSLLVLKYDLQQSKFVEHKLVENWQPTKNQISAATVEADVP